MRNLTLAERVDLNSLLKANTPIHWIHLIISVVTFGIWAPIWAMYSAVMTHARNEILSAYGQPFELNIGAIASLMFILSFVVVLLGIAFGLR